MPPRIDAPVPRTTTLITGHFHEKKGYATWREHGSPDWLLTFTLAGRGRLGFPGGELIVSPGDISLLHPGTLHDYGVEPSLERWEFLWTHFHPMPHWLDYLHWPQAAPDSPGLMRLSITDRPLRRRIRRRLADMNALARGSSPRRADLAMNALEEVLLLCDAANPLQAQSRLDPRIRSTLDFLCQNLEQKITLRLLAVRANISESRLAHLFRQQVGLTPQRFLELRRLDRAKQLLTLTSASIKEIAYHVGFQNPFYFTLRFKRYTRKSPKMFRRAVSGSHSPVVRKA